MQSGNSEINAGSNKNKDKANPGSLAAIDADTKQRKKTNKSTNEDTSQQSGSAGSKSSKNVRRQGRRKSGETLESSASEASRHYDSITNESESRSKGSKLTNVIEVSGHSRISRESVSSQEETRHRRRSKSSSSGEHSSDDSKQRRANRREGSKRPTGDNNEEKVSRSRNKTKELQNQNTPNSSVEEQFGSFPISQSARIESSTFGDTFTAFQSDNVNLGNSFGSFGFDAINQGETNTTSNFDSAFSTEPIFEKFPTTFASVTSAEFGTFDTFDQAPSFPTSYPIVKQNEPTWDKSPLTDIPKMKRGEFTITHNRILACEFLCTQVSNPLNGNIIFCGATNGVICIQEMDLYRKVYVNCIPVLSDELRRKVAQQFNLSAYSLIKVLALQSGLHFASGRTRVRVAAIVELRVLESNESLTVVLIWRWGYGIPLIGLQYVLSPPSFKDLTYICDTLNIADNLVFLAGSSSKESLVFICKPAVSEAWSINALATKAKVTKSTVSNTYNRGDYPYFVIAFSDKSVSVWTYKTAMSATAFKGATPKSCLFPLCLLDHASIHSEMKSSSFDADEKSDTNADGYEMCTEITWLPPESTFSPLMLLAVAFQNGFAVFHVDLPVLMDETSKKVLPLPEPTQTTLISSTPAITPIAAKRWKRSYKDSSIAWVDLGSMASPALSISLLGHKDNDVHLLICSIELPTHRQVPVPTISLLPCHVLTKQMIPKHLSLIGARLLRTGFTNSSLFCTLSDIAIVSLSSMIGELKSAVHSLMLPVTSNAIGLSSTGEPIADDSVNGRDDVIFLFKTVMCDRRRADSKGPSVMEWNLPVQRYSICRSFTGDGQNQQIEEKKEEQGFDSREQSFGGARAELVCELYHESLVGLIPFRIVTCPDITTTAVLFRRSLGSQLKLTTQDGLQATRVALVNPSKTDFNLNVLEGRDIAFVRSNGQNLCRGFLLSEDGAELSYITWDFKDKIEKHAKFRPIVGVNCDKDYIDCRRIILFYSGSSTNFGMIGKRIRDNQICFITGESMKVSEIDSDSWSELIPNIVTRKPFWLEENEEIISATGLESYNNGSRNTALLTSCRVLILSSDLVMLVEKRIRVSSGNIAPMGACAVCFVADEKVQYLCCLNESFQTGVIASLAESRAVSSRSSILAIRPDRLILLNCHSCVLLVEYGSNPNLFYLPAPSTRPALLLEPLVANAVCLGSNQSQSLHILRTVIERFGRKVAMITHGEGEGIGQKGAGITAKVFSILEHYGYKDAASWLLTGTVQFERSSNTVLLPPWLPVSAKISGAFNADAVLHLLSAGDSYLSEYLKSPDHNMPATLPRVSDPACYLASEYADAALANGRAHDAIKMLDLAGTSSADTRILQLTLLLERDKNNHTTKVLELLSGLNENVSGQSVTAAKAAASLAAMGLIQKQNDKGIVSEEHLSRWIKPLAPSLQCEVANKRARQSLMGESILKDAGDKEIKFDDILWASPCNESKHVWNEGPRKNKSQLLTLDRIEDWLERRRPLILGKEGALSTQDRGEKTLAAILNQDDDSFGEKSDIDSVQDIWVDGVGEGRSDEANISGYFRFSEGEDEDSKWNSEGFADLSPYQNKIAIVGDPASFSLMASTSNVDEGEPGKVKCLQDFIFDRSGVGLASGLALPALRGGSLDIGVLHTPMHNARKKCTIEFWYYLPASNDMDQEIILVRRTMGAAADDFKKVCIEADKESMLWELAVRKSGDLVFRTCGGAELYSTQNYEAAEAAKEKDYVRSDLAIFEKWNHVSLVLSSSGIEITNCAVKIYMKGIEVASSILSVLPPGVDKGDAIDDSILNEILQKSHIVMALNHSVGFRLTELRFWACVRSSDDVQSFLYEYLTAAEQKKKFKVKITNKNKNVAKLNSTPLKGISAPNQGGLVPPRGMVPVKSGIFIANRDKLLSTEGQSNFAKNDMSFDFSAERKDQKASQHTTSLEINSSIGAGKEHTLHHISENFGSVEALRDSLPNKPRRRADSTDFDTLTKTEFDDENDVAEEDEGPITLWDTAIALSTQIRASAAAALIRGPPATRHYGGNRGGLPDFSGVERFGVGGIAICGSEKTIVFRDNEDPPALTYPIGASGAVVSDQMDDEGSEFLCCFLAKEKRMVVFELLSRTVVVELQMTTKLNFWRYLPPEAAENTLCFMLVTPVGGFHWMPLEESPRPHQVWKRGANLQGKKIVGYEEGGSNGLDDNEIRSRVGLVMATRASGGGFLEAWIVPIAGDSQANLVSDNILGACFCQPLFLDDGPFLPLIVSVHNTEDGIIVNLLSMNEPEFGSVELKDVIASQEIDISDYEIDYEPPSLAMGTYPEALCVSLSNIIVVILRRKGVIAAFEQEEDQLNLIAQESVDHYVIDAVMRYSVDVGGAEIVMLLADDEDPKDGRVVSFCFRSAA